MAERMEIYSCDLCGQVVEVFEGGAGELACCEEPMDLLKPQTADPSEEKHVPFVEQVEGGIKVRVGKEAAHPMEASHFIQWIEVVAGGKSCRKQLEPGDEPEAFFPCDGSCTADVVVRELCNVHGLWVTS